MTEPDARGSADEANARDDVVRRRAAAWEAAIGVLGALIVLAIVGFLGWRGLQPSMPASIEIVTGRIAAQPDGFLLRYTVRNHGSEAVAALRIVAERDGPGGPMRLAEVTIDHLPGGSSRSGGLLFTEDPRRRPVTVRAVGYADP